MVALSPWRPTTGGSSPRSTENSVATAPRRRVLPLDQKQRGDISPERSEPRKRSQEGCAPPSCAVWCFSPMRWRGRHRYGRVELLRDRKRRGDISPERSEPRKRSQEGCAPPSCAVWCFSPMRWRGRHRYGRVELPLDRKRRRGNGRAGARPSRTRRGSGRVALVATDGTRGYTRSTGGSSPRSTGNGVGNACAELRELAVRRGFPEIAVVEHPA